MIGGLKLSFLFPPKKSHLYCNTDFFLVLGRKPFFTLTRFSSFIHREAAIIAAASGGGGGMALNNSAKLSVRGSFSFSDLRDSVLVVPSYPCARIES